MLDSIKSDRAREVRTKYLRRLAAGSAIDAERKDCAFMRNRIGGLVYGIQIR
jgi:hypothetical protein